MRKIVLQDKKNERFIQKKEQIINKFHMASSIRTATMQ